MRPIPTAILCLMLLATATVRAGVLPVVSDADTGAAWWVDEGAAPVSALDEALFDAAERGDAAWVSPRAGRSVQISRIFRTPDISPRNAASVGALFDASHVLWGTVGVADEAEIPWLGIRRVTVELQATLIDVETGVAVSEVVVRRTSHGGEGDARAQAYAAVAGALSSGAIVTSSTLTEGPPMDGVVAVRSTTGAAPFVSLRGALREVHPGVVDVSEVWATEGMVGLTFALDEGVAFADVAAAVHTLEGVQVDAARVVSVDDEAGGLVVRVDAALPDDTAAP